MKFMSMMGAATLLWVSSVQATDEIQLMPCDCAPEQFSSAAFEADTGNVYVYNKAEDGVRAFKVSQKQTASQRVTDIEEIDSPRADVVTALTEVLKQLEAFKSIRQAETFAALKGMESAVDVAGRFAKQRQLREEISTVLQQQTAAEIQFLFDQVKHAHQVTELLDWLNIYGKRITFEDGSYLDLKRAEAIVFDADEVTLNVEVVHLVDNQGKVVGETASDYIGLSLAGESDYLEPYQSLLSRIGFAVTEHCTTTASAQPSAIVCADQGQACTRAEQHPSC